MTSRKTRLASDKYAKNITRRGTVRVFSPGRVAAESEENTPFFLKQYVFGCRWPSKLQAYDSCCIDFLTSVCLVVSNSAVLVALASSEFICGTANATISPVLP